MVIVQLLHELFSLSRIFFPYLQCVTCFDLHRAIVRPLSYW
nr:MAG TPA: hypothetical protein [Caudoviricetes sp.]